MPEIRISAVEAVFGHVRGECGQSGREERRRKKADTGNPCRRIYSVRKCLLVLE